MRYDRLMSLIERSTNSYKKKVLSIVEETQREKEKLQRDADKYSDTYMRAMMERCDEIAESKLNRVRKVAYPTIEHFFDLLGAELDNFFKGKIDPEIASKAQTFQALNLKLNQRELDSLLKSAKSYYDLRILSQMAESMGLRFTEGDFTNTIVSDIDRACTTFEGFKKQTLFAIEYYVGDNNELANCAPNDKNGNRPEPWLLSSASTTLRNHASQDSFSEIADKVFSVLSNSKPKTSLTERETALIDVLIDSRYPSLARERVYSICSSSEELADLLSLDSRYSEMVNDFYIKQASETEVNEQ